MRADIKIGVEEEKVMAEQLNNSSLAPIIRTGMTDRPSDLSYYSLVLAEVNHGRFDSAF